LAALTDRSVRRSRVSTNALLELQLLLFILASFVGLDAIHIVRGRTRGNESAKIARRRATLVWRRMNRAVSFVNFSFVVLVQIYAG
jgi:hypothetical protein